MQLSDDAAYPSMYEVQEDLGNGRSVTVEVRTLDEIWVEIGRPKVSFVKIDVEGAEVEVIRGANGFISQCVPTLLIEANAKEQLQHLIAVLIPYGYKLLKPTGFRVHNYLFICPAS